MNNSYYETLDENFNTALELINKTFTQKELIEMLQYGNIPQKQLAALRLESITSAEDAKVLIENLTGQDGKIREAVSLRINEFMSNPHYKGYFENTKSYDVFLEAIIDINANICRNIISAITNLKNNKEFSKYFCEKLTQKTYDLLDLIKKFGLKDRKYKVNKEIFKLYWCLETIYEFSDSIDFNDLKQILLISKNIEEYTIREKAAKILSKNFDDNELREAKKELKLDRNYYVSRY